MIGGKVRAYRGGTTSVGYQQGGGDFLHWPGTSLAGLQFQEFDIAVYHLEIANGEGAGFYVDRIGDGDRDSRHSGRGGDSEVC